MYIEIMFCARNEILCVEIGMKAMAKCCAFIVEYKAIKKQTLNAQANKAFIKAKLTC